MWLLKRFVAVAVLVISAAVAVAVPAADAAPYCGITWGSLPRTYEVHSSAEIAAGRVGHHDCFDRLVIEISGPAVPGFRAMYVDQVVSEGEGAPVPVAGGARIQFAVLAPAFNQFAHSPTVFFDTPAFPTLKQVAGAGSFEGQTVFAVGVRSRLPFRVFTLPGPGTHSRVVLDIAHRWQ